MFNQIPFMKINRFLSLIALTALIASCSDDDDAKPNVDNVELSLAKRETVVTVPQGLLNSEDPMAMMAASYVSMANGISSSLALFDPPAGAKKTNSLIEPVNGRTAAGSGVVYTWSDPEYGSVAYQVRDNDSKYVFEFLYKGINDSDWYRYLYAEEKKDGSEGYLAVYNADEGEDRGEEVMRWTWKQKGDIFTFSISSDIDDENFLLAIEVNTKTNAGAIIFHENSKKQFEIEWNAQGAGTWVQYDNNGNIEDEGSWS